VTLAPLVVPDIRGVKGAPVELSQWCVAPGCLSLAQQRHHLWPKSYLRGQPFEWVEVAGKVMPNSVGLCVAHHGQVTGEVGGHTAKIVYDVDLGLFEWHTRGTADEYRPWEKVGLLRNQGLLEPEPEAKRVRREEGLCPTCGRAQPHEKRTTQNSLPKRKAKTWSLLVPDDAENGADVLDTLVEDLAVLMGLEPSSPRLIRYHVLAPTLIWVTMHKSEFVADWEEAEA
jgi:hypothetical protein